MTSIRKHIFKFVDHGEKKTVSICLHFKYKHPEGKEKMEISFNDRKGYYMWVAMMGEMDFGQRQAAAVILRDYLLNNANPSIKIKTDPHKLNTFPGYKFIKEKSVCKSKMWNLSSRDDKIEIDGGAEEDKICQVYGKGHIDKISDLKELAQYKEEHYDETFVVTGKFPVYQWTIQNEHKLFPNWPNGKVGTIDLTAFAASSQIGRPVRTTDTVETITQDIGGLQIDQIPVEEAAKRLQQGANFVLPPGTLSTNAAATTALTGGYRTKGSKNKHHKGDWEDDMMGGYAKGSSGQHHKKKKSGWADGDWEDDDKKSKMAGWTDDGEDWDAGFKGGYHEGYAHDGRRHNASSYEGRSKKDLIAELEHYKAKMYGDAADRMMGGKRGMDGW
jgi:hypothetical protein